MDTRKGRWAFLWVAVLAAFLIAGLGACGGGGSGTGSGISVSAE